MAQEEQYPPYRIAKYMIDGSPKYLSQKRHTVLGDIPGEDPMFIYKNITGTKHIEMLYACNEIVIDIAENQPVEYIPFDPTK